MVLAPCNKGGQGEIGFFPNNISKIDCQIAGICYNKCVATFWLQKISKP